MVFLGAAAVICVLVCIENEMVVLLVLHGNNPDYSLTGLEKLAIGELRRTGVSVPPELDNVKSEKNLHYHESKPLKEAEIVDHGEANVEEVTSKVSGGSNEATAVEFS